MKYWDFNVNGTRVLLEAMSRHKCHTIIFSSSATIYGNSDNFPIKENNKINPINPYGKTKAAVEQMLEDVYLSSPDKWKIANLRYFNPVGAHPSGQIGENPLETPKNLFPFISMVAIGELEELKIFGCNWPTPDGTCIRDYIHVMDLAEGHKKALEYLFINKPQLISLNLGTGKGYSVLEIVNTFEKINNCNVPYSFHDRREGDIAISFADNNLAKLVLEWEPKNSLNQMCKDSWNWHLYKHRRLI